MKRFLPILSILLLYGCGICKHAQPTVIYRDSTRVEYRDRTVTDTVEVRIPELYVQRETFDTLSVIENKYARTAAVVHDGILSHDLKMKPKVIEVPIVHTVTDTLIVHTTGNTVIETVEVEKKLTWAQQFFLWFGKLSLLLSALVMCFLIIKLSLKKSNPLS